MTAISMAVASERAKRYRELAHDARVQATRSEHVPRIAWAYMSMAARWEEFALEADAEAEDMSGCAPDSAPQRARWWSSAAIRAPAPRCRRISRSYDGRSTRAPLRRGNGESRLFFIG